eukprot:CAMPEP_0195143616 /NCGR_PEP_ID=MMETSP0448-20130528/166672_1 /TAXON_ID=66468 /ORGANISM="Heterocapsa triquestra, Strain CCMP 448" /LENGTH=65 /DNA_ID=CAMNT_0040182055 /DNA_START=129 /DNA_END=323 /DNA_ORIENTATION=+
MITGGNNMGCVGVITHRERHPDLLRHRPQQGRRRPLLRHAPAERLRHRAGQHAVDLGAEGQRHQA